MEMRASVSGHVDGRFRIGGSTDRRARIGRAVVAFLAIGVAANAQAPDHGTQRDRPVSQFAMVNGVRLHYLDWGGKGEVVLFLTSLGGTAEDFHPLAVGLTDRFQVLGLTRRGQGESGRPDTGYDTTQLVEDVRAFLDQRKVKHATLAGYSIAGNELTEFARLYPRRCAKLVYLDAAYDLAQNAEPGRKARLNLPPLPGADKATLELIARSNEYHPDYTGIEAPALGVFVTYDEPPKSALWDEATKAKLLAWWDDYGKAYRREQIERFERDMKKATVVELHNTTHGGFLFEKEQQTILNREIRKFLLEGR